MDKVARAMHVVRTQCRMLRQRVLWGWVDLFGRPLWGGKCENETGGHHVGGVGLEARGWLPSADGNSDNNNTNGGLKNNNNNTIKTEEDTSQTAGSGVESGAAEYHMLQIETNELQSKWFQLMLQLVSCLCDLPLSLQMGTARRRALFSPEFLAVCGFVSSIASFRIRWQRMFCP